MAPTPVSGFAKGLQLIIDLRILKHMPNTVRLS
jgi:hypothetical protein